jgi:hypothetical protein
MAVFFQPCNIAPSVLAEDKDGVTTSSGPMFKTGFTKTGHFV